MKSQRICYAHGLMVFLLVLLMALVASAVIAGGGGGGGGACVCLQRECQTVVVHAQLDPCPD